MSSLLRSAGAVLAGSLVGMRRDAASEFLAEWQAQGDVARLHLGPRGVGRVATLLVRPEHVEHVLVRNARNYSLSASYAVLEGFLGDGLLTSQGDRWRRHRRLVQPAFAPSALAVAAPHFVAAATDAADRLTTGSGQQVDLAAEMGRLTLDAVGRALFGADLDAEAGAVGRALRVVQDFTVHAAYFPAPAAVQTRLKDLPTPGATRYRAAVRELDRVVAGLVDRHTPAPAGGDLLSMVSAAAVDGEPGNHEVRDQVMTFLLAGHETTAAALTWTLALLSRHPEVRRRVVAELDEVLGGRPVTQSDIASLPLLSAVLKESLRLFPPAWTIERRAEQADEVDGHVLPAGSTVLLSPYLTHRHPEFWDNPEGFDPDRWLDAGPVLPRGAYVPFGAGARQCIGGAFATLEATLMLATLLPRVQVDLAPGPPLRPVPRITLTAGAGMPAVARARTAPVPAPRTYARRSRPVDGPLPAAQVVGQLPG
jgi:cytochrome P450